MTEVHVEIAGDHTHEAEAVKRAAEMALAFENAPGNINIVLADDNEIKRLNHAYRNIDQATDVLSFAANEGEAILSLPDGFLGDIVISLERARAQAREYGHSLERELSFLAVHGTLHLLGYDHIKDAEALKMNAKEAEILEIMRMGR